MQKTDLVLVSYNSKKDLERFLPSIVKHTSDYNLIIVDNGSKEETTKYLYESGERVIFQENKGYGTACNEGAKRGKNEIIVFLNCDLLATDKWLENLLEPFKDPKVAISGVRLFREDLVEFPTPTKDKVIGCCLAIRRNIFERLKGFDEKFFLFFEEDDLCLRARKAGYKVARSEAKLIHYHPNFPPFPEHLQRYWDESKKYFFEKHKEIFNRPTIALVMIVKNEEKGLERAILSCKDFVDEIVIAVDKSSTDKTEEIAKKYATTLKHFDWQDDFSAARNFAHEGVKSDWILFLDGHEYVEKSDNLETALKFSGDGLMCTIKMENGMEFGNPRLYKKGCSFFGRVHEKQKCDRTMPYPDFVVVHDRVCGQAMPAAVERTRQRHDQILRIMGEEYKKDKKNVRASFHLALHFQGIKQFKKANKWWKKYLKYAKPKGERWFAYFSMSLNSLFLGHLFRAFWYANKADNETPGRWETTKLMGIIYQERKRYSEAAEYFVESMHENVGVVDYKPWPDDRAALFNLVGECLFNMSVYDRAFLAFSHASSICEDYKMRILFQKRADLVQKIAENSKKK